MLIRPFQVWACAFVGAHPEWCFVPRQANTAQDAFGVGRDRAGHGILFAGALALQDGNLKSVECPTDAGRAHRMAQHLQAFAQVLQATEGHVAEGDMGLYPPRLPVIDGSDFQVVLVGTKAGFDLPELVILGDGRLGCEIVLAMDSDGMQPIPLGRRVDLVLIKCDLARIGKREEPGISPVTDTGRAPGAPKLRLQALKGLLALVGILAGAGGREGDDDPGTVMLNHLVAPRLRRAVSGPWLVTTRVQGLAFHARRADFRR